MFKEYASHKHEFVFTISTAKKTELYVATLLCVAVLAALAACR
jgi:hypothetical protein